MTVAVAREAGTVIEELLVDTVETLEDGASDESLVVDVTIGGRLVLILADDGSLAMEVVEAIMLTDDTLVLVPVDVKFRNDRGVEDVDKEARAIEAPPDAELDGSTAVFVIVVVNVIIAVTCTVCVVVTVAKPSTVMPTKNGTDSSGTA